MVRAHPLVIDPADLVLERVRSQCLRYPESAEVWVWGRPTFRVGKKIFVVVGAAMQQPRTMIFKPDPEDEPALRQHPLVFSPPYWGPGGWLAIELDHSETDWQHVAELVDASYRLVALKRQCVALDAAPVLR